MDLATFLNTPLMRVKLATLVHFFFISNALMGHYLPPSYVFYNVLFFVALFWAIHCRESVDAILIATLINASSIVFDLVCIVAFFSSYNNAWSIIFSIINLVARPFTLILLHKEIGERGGTISLGSVYPTNTQRSYEDIDQPKQSVPTNSAGQPNISNIF